MNWKCKIGWHDWETYSVKTESTIKNQVYKELLSPRTNCGVKVGHEHAYAKKVCLRCKKRVDEITPVKERIEDKVLRSIERRETLKACLKE